MNLRLRERPLSKMIVPVLLATGAVVLPGCGSSSSSGPATTVASPPKAPATAANAVNPNVPESLPPGDIPDTVAYVPYAVPGAGYTVSAPEGWSRSTTGSAVRFTDKLNAIEITAVASNAPRTVNSVTRSVVPKLASSVKGFKLQSVTVVARKGGPAIRTIYFGYSTPDPVTGKFGLLAIERYDFAHKGRDVILTLSAPNGSDNVDPWNRVTNSLAFTR
jgi:hypothetical protein